MLASSGRFSLSDGLAHICSDTVLKRDVSGEDKIFRARCEYADLLWSDVLKRR